MVRATQKGEMENPSPEIAKVASSVSKSDVKKMASTKHKGLPEKKEIKEVWGAVAKVALGAAKGAVKQKAKQVVAQKAVNVARGSIPQPNRDQQEAVSLDPSKGGAKTDVGKTEDQAQKKMDQIKKQVLLKKLQAVRSGAGETVTASHHPEGEMTEGIGRAAIGAGVGAMVGGPVGAAAGAAIGASLGKKKVTTGGNKVKKKATNFFKAEPKVTRSEEISIVDKMLIEYSPTIVYQAKGGKKSGKLGKSSIYSLRDKDESKKDFRKSHVKDVEDGYVGKGHKPTPGSLKKEEIETLRKIVEEVGISSSAAMAKAQKEAKLKAKEDAAVAKKKKVTEAKVDTVKKLDDEGKEDARNIRRYGHVPYNKHGHSVLRRSEHRMRRGDKKRPGHKEVNVETGKVGKEIGEAYRVLAKDKTDLGRPAAFSYKDEKDAKKFADSIKSKGGKATVHKEGVGDNVMKIVNKYRKKQKKSPHKYPEGRVYKDPGEAAKRKLKAAGQAAVGIFPDDADKYPERSSNKK